MHSPLKNKAEIMGKKRIQIALIISIILGFVSSTNCKNIGLLIMATGRYIEFIPQLRESARKYFCPKHKVTFFIFTDGSLDQQPDTKIIYQKRLGWPYDTLLRCQAYYDYRDSLVSQDYLFALDADMCFLDPIGDEIFSERVATFHPGFYGQRGPYESRKESTAYIHHSQGKYYFAGGFYGGTTKEFIQISQIMVNNIYIDLEKNIIATWHDESQLNRYFATYLPTRILTPDYCYPQSYPKEQWWLERFKPKLMALDKDHDEMHK